MKIYATDVDEDALTTARHAHYARDLLKPVHHELGSATSSPPGRVHVPAATFAAQ